LDLRNRTLCGTFHHAPRPGAVDLIEDGLVEIGPDGVIAAVIRAGDPGGDEARRRAAAAGRLTVLPSTVRVLPGFVDLHLHAPQYPQIGTALDRPLEEWLHSHTFPLEARFADLAFARPVYEGLVDDLLANGTTTAMLFATIHDAATRLLVDICLEKGLRALVGRVAMDDPATCPDDYRDPSAAVAIEGSAALIDYVRAHPDNAGGSVLPVVTPRFIPSCSDDLLEGLGGLARDRDCHVQTHCSESDWQDAYAQERFGRRDAECLDRFGLMTARTVLAHGVLLSDGDMELIAARGAGVAHCPLSNVYLSSAVFPLRAALAKGLKVGLGTDVAGGPSLSMFSTARATVAVSRVLEQGADPALAPDMRGRPGSAIDWRTAFHLATAGGAAALGLPIGTFEPGRAFDAMLIDLEAPDASLRIDDDADEETVLQKILYTAARANIAAVWVGGRGVAGRAAQAGS
jgi:guanine deaminase